MELFEARTFPDVVGALDECLNRPADRSVFVVLEDWFLGSCLVVRGALWAAVVGASALPLAARRRVDAASRAAATARSFASGAGRGTAWGARRGTAWAVVRLAGATRHLQARNGLSGATFVGCGYRLFFAGGVARRPTRKNFGACLGRVGVPVAAGGPLHPSSPAPRLLHAACWGCLPRAAPKPGAGGPVESWTPPRPQSP